MEMADGDRLTPEQAEALSALRDGRNVFLSGNAGTGKSYVLNAFISDLISSPWRPPASPR
mgnify:CR=1 FL=1